MVRDSIKSRGEAPSLTEMMKELGLSTKKSVAFHLDALERKGFIVRTGAARGIRIIESFTEDFIQVPLLGYANAGEPLALANEENLGEIMVDKKILKNKKKIFGVELKGDSMNQKIMNGIPLSNGNYAIIAKEEEVRNNDVVLAIINDGATVKMFKQEGDTVILYPSSSNPVHKPIYLDKTNSNFIAGKVITVLSNPSRSI